MTTTRKMKIHCQKEPKRSLLMMKSLRLFNRGKNRPVNQQNPRQITKDLTVCHANPRHPR
jgi:hypothetical protein